MKKQAYLKVREEARRLYLTGEMGSNAEIAARLNVKPHTVGKWRKTEDWDGLRLKIDRKAAELFVEKIATDKVTLNLTHYKLWALLLSKLTEDIQRKENLDVSEMTRIASIIERAQKGQRLAKGLSMNGENEETLRAQYRAQIQGLVDQFVDAIKENIDDEETRDRIRRSLLSALPAEEDAGAG